MSDYTQEELDQAFQEGQSEERTYTDLPEGVVDRAKIADCRMETNEYGRRWSIRWVGVSVPGSNWSNWNLDHPVGAQIAGRSAAAMGFVAETGTRTELELAITQGAFNDLECEIFVKKTPGEKRDFIDIYVNKRLLASETAENPGGFTDAELAAAASDEDIPF